jgi:hypothetical protein
MKMMKNSRRKIIIAVVLMKGDVGLPPLLLPQIPCVINKFNTMVLPGYNNNSSR